MKKKIIYTLLALVFFAFNAYAKSPAEAFKANEVNFYGLCFTKVSLIGSDGFKNPKEIIDKWFPSWNELFVKEQKKYDLTKTIRKDKINYIFDPVNQANSKVSINGLVTENKKILDRQNIADAVKHLNIKEKDGIGLVFVVEYFDKNSDLGSFYFVYFDIATKTPLVIENITAKPGGFGFRNYWARVFSSGLKDISDNYEKWRSNYSK